MRTPTNKENKQVLWQQRLSEARGHEGSQRAYCKGSGISYSQFQYWRSKLEGSGKAGGAKISDRAASMLTPFARVALQAPEPVTSSVPVAGARFIAEVLWHLSGMVGS